MELGNASCGPIIKETLLEVTMSEEEKINSEEQTPSEEQHIPIENKSAGNEDARNAADIGDPTIFEKAVGTAREQAGAATDSLRRGELMHGAVIDPEATGDDRLIALLAYASQIFIPLIMPIIILISESGKKRPFQRYHAVQSLALSLVFMGLFAAGSIGAAIGSFIPIVGWAMGLALVCLMPIAYVMALVAMVYYGYQAYQGKRFAIPGLTSFLKDQGWI